MAVTTPTRIKHVIWLVPQDFTLEELQELVASLHPTKSAFTYSADVAHAVMFAGNDSSVVKVVDPHRWADDIVAWFDERGCNTEVIFWTTPTTDADGFDSPVGTEAERAAHKWPSGKWVDVNPYGNQYTNPSTGNVSYHTGSDLNLNDPYWDADRDADVYAAADGEVIFAGWLSVWGNVIVIRHPYNGGNVYTRYGHVREMSVLAGDYVLRGDRIARVGQDALGGPFHLHFDISTTEALASNPGDWPGGNLTRLQRDYVNPAIFIPANRPVGDDPGEPPPPPPPPPPAEYRYTGPSVTLTPMLHAPGSDWKWGDVNLRSMLDRVKLPVKLMTNGSHLDFYQYAAPVNLVRIFWQPQPKSKEAAWADDMRDNVQRALDRGLNKFEILNEPNLGQEGLGIAWNNKEEFGVWLEYIATKVRALGGKPYYPGFSPGVPWTNQFVWTNYLWPKYKHLFNGFCLHAYSGNNTDATAAAADITAQVVEAQKHLKLQVPMIVSEASVNRGTDYLMKARTYRLAESSLSRVAGIEGIVWFISWWDAPPEQQTHGENWLGTSLPDHYLSL